MISKVFFTLIDKTNQKFKEQKINFEASWLDGFSKNP
jgi:hypothetical protein